MARFRPLRSIRYANDKVGDLTAVVAPPYDVIDDAMRERLLAGSPYNVTRLILNKEGHDAAAEVFSDWQANGALVRDETASFYLYAQEFDAEGPRRRVGVLGALHLEAFSTGVVLRHETTFAHHKQDRLELTRRVRANLSPIFGTFSNPDFRPAPEGGWEAPAIIDVMHEGVRHRMWAISDPATVEGIEQAVADRAVFIADGHHRYETALNYWYERHDNVDPPTAQDAPRDDEAPDAHVLTFLAAFEDPGLVILPTHREMRSSGGADHARFEKQLAANFTVERFDRDDAGAQALIEGLRAADTAENAFGVILRDLSVNLLVRRPVDETASSPLAKLDVKVLHDAILGHALSNAGGGEAELAYSIDPRVLMDKVASGTLEGAFLMNATRAEEMAYVCLAGELMPQKSTYYYPKLLTGLVFHALE